MLLIARPRAEEPTPLIELPEELTPRTAPPEEPARQTALVVLEIWATARTAPAHPTELVVKTSPEAVPDRTGVRWARVRADLAAAVHAPAAARGASSIGGGSRRRGRWRPPEIAS